MPSGRPPGTRVRRLEPHRGSYNRGIVWLHVAYGGALGSLVGNAAGILFLPRDVIFRVGFAASLVIAIASRHTISGHKPVPPIGDPARLGAGWLVCRCCNHYAKWLHEKYCRTCVEAGCHLTPGTAR